MKRSLLNHKLMAALVNSLFVLTAFAQDPPIGEKPSVAGADLASPERFGQYGDNYAIYDTMRNSGWAAHDESAIRAHYSLKFTFCGPQFDRRREANGPTNPGPRGPTLCPQGEKSSQVELFAAYTGEFDFYLGTRQSGPVINRLSNPGLFARIPLRLYFPALSHQNDHVEIGVEHRSNGQVTEVTEPRDSERAQAAYDARDRFYFDTVSRGANYVSVAARKYSAFGDDRVELHGKLRLYWNQDSAVTWGPLAKSGRKVSDYDRVQLMAAFQQPGWGRWELEWRVGDRGLSTDSFNLGWQYGSGSFPLYVRLHYGPFNTLSNYTQRQDSFGVGLRFANF
jgi:outer membrane phospholipase A